MIQSFVYSVKSIGDKTHICGMPLEMYHSPDNTHVNILYISYIFIMLYIYLMTICIKVILILCKKMY